MNGLAQDICSKHKLVVQWMPTDSYDSIVQVMKNFNAYGLGSSLIVANCSGECFDAADVENLQYTAYDIPKHCDNNAKAKNFILSSLAQQLGNFRFLHILEGNVQLLKDPTSYLEDLGNAMDALDYSIYFSTTSDPCNYVFKKFCPRLTIDMDDEDIKSKLKLPSSISFTSHSNTIWTTYDYAKCNDTAVQLYDEQFTIAMFMIIEYLARRRATRQDGQLYYMNQYLSIPSEVGVFTYNNLSKMGEIDPRVMQEEDLVFKKMNVDYTPDNNLDIVLNAFYEKVKSKMQQA